MPGAPGTLAILLAFIGLFLGGAAIGGALAEMFAPGSWLAAVAGFGALPLAFALGLQAWYGLALLSLVPRLIGMMRGVPVRPAPHQQTPGAGIPGSFVFLPLSSMAGLVSGLVVGIMSPTHPAWLVALLYWLVGTGHGALAWRLARMGVLIPPESV
jgi:hypothetical protein